MMSNTSRTFNGQILHNAMYPSATHYDTIKFNTIENPMITGGSPNNTLTLKKYEKSLREKLMNPFRTNDVSHDKTVLIENQHLGPGLYSPSYPDDIGQHSRSRT